MISVIRQFFEKNSTSSPDTAEKLSGHSLRLATASLLIEMMRADTEINEEEKITITEIIHSKFCLSGAEIDDLLQRAEDEIFKATGYFEFTSLINKGFSYDEKVQVIEYLWEVAFSDSSLDKHEEYMVRKIAGLIYVSHEDFIDAKIRVKKRLSL